MSEDAEDWAPRPESQPDLHASLVPRPLAVAVLIAIAAAGALSAWLVLNADLESAASPTPPHEAPEDPRRPVRPGKEVG